MDDKSIKKILTKVKKGDLAIEKSEIQPGCEPGLAHAHRKKD